MVGQGYSILFLFFANSSLVERGSHAQKLSKVLMWKRPCGVPSFFVEHTFRSTFASCRFSTEVRWAGSFLRLWTLWVPVGSFVITFFFCNLSTALKWPWTSRRLRCGQACTFEGEGHNRCTIIDQGPTLLRLPQRQRSLAYKYQDDVDSDKLYVIDSWKHVSVQIAVMHLKQNPTNPYHFDTDSFSNSFVVKCINKWNCLSKL